MAIEHPIRIIRSFGQLGQIHRTTVEKKKLPVRRAASTMGSQLRNETGHLVHAPTPARSDTAVAHVQLHLREFGQVFGTKQ